MSELIVSCSANHAGSLSRPTPLFSQTAQPDDTPKLDADLIAPTPKPEPKPAPKPEPVTAPVAVTVPQTHKEKKRDRDFFYRQLETVQPPPGTVLGEGTKDDPLLPPIKYTSMRRSGIRHIQRPIQSLWDTPKECGCGRWYVPISVVQRQCHYCRIAKVHKEDNPKFNAKQAMQMETRAGAFWADTRQKFKKWAQTLGPDADDKKNVNFGAYGNIECTERHVIAARLLAYGCDVLMVSDVTDIPLFDLLECQDGGGSQPKLDEMVAFYSAQHDMWNNVRRLRTVEESMKDAKGLKDSPKKLAEAYGKMVDLQNKVAELFPERPKRSKIDFGKDEATLGLRKMAADWLAQFLRDVPSDRESNVAGGPGPTV